MNNKTFAGLALGFVAVGALLTVFILSKREETGFIMRPCNTGGVLDLVHWNHENFPIPVYFQPEAQDWRQAVIDGAELWENAANHKLFAIGPTLDSGEEVLDPAIVVSVSNADGSEESYEAQGSPAHLFWDSTCNLRRVVLLMPGLTLPELHTKIAAHEMGHALGFDHSKAEGTVMFHSVRFIGTKVTTAELVDLAMALTP